MKSISGSEVSMGVKVGPSFGRVKFELFLLLLKAVGVALLGLAVSVSAWAAWAAPDPVGGAVHPAPSVGMGDNNYGSSG